MKTSFAEELGSCSPAGCFEAVEWVADMAARGHDDNSIWKLCTCGDWLHWLLLDAFSFDGQFQGRVYHEMVRSLRKATHYDLFSSTPMGQALLADRIRKLFPEWPL